MIPMCRPCFVGDTKSTHNDFNVICMGNNVLDPLIFPWGILMKTLIVYLSFKFTGIQDYLQTVWTQYGGVLYAHSAN